MPREDSTGGKQKLGPISKQGDRYLRRVLVLGAHAVLKRARLQPEKYLSIGVRSGPQIGIQEGPPRFAFRTISVRPVGAGRGCGDGANAG